MNRRQKKKEYKKRVGCNPPKGRKIFIPISIEREKTQKKIKAYTKSEVGRWMKTAVYNMEYTDWLMDNWRKKQKRIEPITVTAKSLTAGRKERRGANWRRTRRNK